MAEKMATRVAYGEALLELGKENENIVVIDADLCACTKTDLFAEAFPDRYFNLGIAESNMVGVAAGLATCGKIAIANSFAMFSAGRAFEQIRNSVAYPNLNVKIVGTHAGLSVGKDGATHQCLEDIGVLRTVPNMTILCPADSVETYHAFKAAIEHEGPVYLRLGRLPVDTVNDNDDYHFELGKGILMKPGSDLTIVTTGLMLQEALAAREELLAEGIEARIVHIPTIKPLDEEIIVKAAEETGLVITAEEHNIMGGLGSAVAEVLAEQCPVRMRRIGTNDVFGKSGEPHDLMREYGLDAATIVKVAKEEFRKKQG
ncbi:MAG: transketolase family protein [Firmicutes bacterium]|nr:transketolase family protein [Bacillota bacterium]